MPGVEEQSLNAGGANHRHAVWRHGAQAGPETRASHIGHTRVAGFKPFGQLPHTGDIQREAVADDIGKTGDADLAIQGRYRQIAPRASTAWRGAQSTSRMRADIEYPLTG